jgi:hypothetical protein
MECDDDPEEEEEKLHQQAIAAERKKELQDESDEEIDSLISFITQASCHITQNNTTVVAAAVSCFRGRGGSRRGKAPNIERNRHARHEWLQNAYFVEKPLFPEQVFRRRFRMHRALFMQLVEELCAADPYFRQKPDATGALGISAIQKVTAALRILCYGIPTDLVGAVLTRFCCCSELTVLCVLLQCDELMHMGASTANECFKR